MSKIKEEIKNLKTEIGIHDLLIQDLFSNAIRKLDKDAAQYLKREIEKSALDASKIYDFVKAEKTKFSVDKINEIIEMLNAQKPSERKPIEKETKELFCCSHMAQAIDKGLFKVISYNTDLARFRYLVFSFIDADFSRSAIIQYCPFCGKKVGIQTKDSIGEETEKLTQETGNRERGCLV